MIRSLVKVSASPLVLVVLLGCNLLFAAEPATQREWELVRSVSNPYGGTIDLVLIQEQKQRDRSYYGQIAEGVCLKRTTCMVMFWAHRTHIPSSADMPVVDLRLMTATYERHPSYAAPLLSLACWLYPSKEAGENMKCFYMPGAVLPWEK